MFPVSSAANGAVRPVQPAEQASALRSSPQQAAETARASAGETSAANVRTESAQAVKAAEQAAVVARLRDQERAEQFAYSVPTDAPAGPPPAFEESPLERQARLAFEPPEAPSAPAPQAVAPETSATVAEAPREPPVKARDIDPPPTPRERAETSFAETRTLSTPKERATVDVEI